MSASTTIPNHSEVSKRRSSSASAQPPAPLGAPRARPSNNLHNSNNPYTTNTRSDPFYGHETIARISARFITHLFACPENPPASGANAPHGKLPFFIAYALHRTKLHTSVTFAALVLLQRLKTRFPTARGSSGHRLFISAYMIASKVICDDTYSNKSWAIVAQGMFNLREINQMEREMCGYLDWELTVDNPILGNFEAAVRQDFATDKPDYPNYPTSMVSKRPPKPAPPPNAPQNPETTTTTTTVTSSSPVPAFSASRNSTPSKPPQQQQAPVQPSSSMSSPASWRPDDVPDTPPASYSTSASPASSASPRTPANVEMSHPQIKEPEVSPQFRLRPLPNVHPLKGHMFAFAVPSLW